MSNRMPLSVITVRPERAPDHETVRRIHASAFGGPTEASLVHRLRGSPGSLSLVATEWGDVIGHILFTSATLAGRPLRLAGLGPMAVHPTRQRIGVGSTLVRSGLEECRHAGYQAVVVVGHPGYYPRFGFQHANRFGLRCQFDVPAEVFMALELQPGSLLGGGEVQYAAAFSEE